MDASSPLEPPEAAAILTRKAGEDATAVREFAANPEIADGIIGFHAQQGDREVAQGGCRGAAAWTSSTPTTSVT